MHTLEVSLLLMCLVNHVFGFYCYELSISFLYCDIFYVMSIRFPFLVDLIHCWIGFMF